MRLFCCSDSEKAIKKAPQRGAWCGRQESTACFASLACCLLGSPHGRLVPFAVQSSTGVFHYAHAFSGPIPENKKSTSKRCLVRSTGIEPACPGDTRSLVLRVCQFRHDRMPCRFDLYNILHFRDKCKHFFEKI